MDMIAAQYLKWWRLDKLLKRWWWLLHSSQFN